MTGTSLLRLKQADCNLVLKFRNAHAIVLSGKDYIWLCDLNGVKGLDVRPTYRSNKSARTFVNYIANTARSETAGLPLEKVIFSASQLTVPLILPATIMKIFMYAQHMTGRYIKSFLPSGCPSRLKLLIFMSMYSRHSINFKSVISGPNWWGLGVMAQQTCRGGDLGMLPGLEKIIATLYCCTASHTVWNLPFAMPSKRPQTKCTTVSSLSYLVYITSIVEVQR